MTIPNKLTVSAFRKTYMTFEKDFSDTYRISKEKKVLSTEKEFSLIELNKPKDWSNLTEMAKKHVPIIEAPEKVKAKVPFAVKVKVGGIDGVEHPNTLGHWINWVELYAGRRLISRVEFGPEMADGYAVSLNVTLNETATLIAREFCNLHGIWKGKERRVTVE